MFVGFLGNKNSGTAKAMEFLSFDETVINRKCMEVKTNFISGMDFHFYRHSMTDIEQGFHRSDRSIFG